MPFHIFGRDHLLLNMGIICGPGSFAVLRSFAVLGSFAIGDEFNGALPLSKLYFKLDKTETEYFKRNIGQLIFICDHFT